MESCVASLTAPNLLPSSGSCAGANAWAADSGVAIRWGANGVGLAHIVAYEVACAVLPRAALVDLVERSGESRVGVRDDEPHAHRPTRAASPQEDGPRVVWFGLHHVGAQDAPPAVRVAAVVAALDVGGVELDEGHWRAVEGPCARILDVCVQARGDCAHLVLREPGDAYLLGCPLHLAGAGARGVHFGHGGHEGAVDAPVAIGHVLREEAAGA